MEASDSQLSEIIKQGRMNESQGTTANRTLEEFSQNTQQKIADGEYMLPGLSQGGFDTLREEIYPIVQDMGEIGVEPKAEFSLLKEKKVSASEIISYASTTSLCSKQSRQPELKKRTNRIQDKTCEDYNNNLSTNRNSHGVDETILDRATHMINDSWKKHVQSGSQDQSADLLSVSFESNFTVSQKTLDSETKVDYLRNRTAEEQKEHCQQKKLAKASKKAKEEHYDSEFVPRYQYELEEATTIPIEQQAPDFGERDIFADEESEEINIVVDKTPKPEEEDEWMTLQINQSKIKKLSDYVVKSMPTGETYLWTKPECGIPLEVRWRVSTKWKEPLSLRVRFVNYDKSMTIEKAIDSPISDVRKCRNHIENEASGVPAESFFYVGSPGAEWKFPGKEKHLTGHFFGTTLPMGATGKDFEIKFSCQEKCMDLSEKRKKMCLVVFLEDEEGAPILHDFFKEVRIVAYPRRDYRNFCEKVNEGETKVEPKWPGLSHPYNLLPRDSLPHFQYTVDMNNVTNMDQMYPSTSAAYRKRVACDMSQPSSSMSSILPKSEYQKRLMLGQNCRGDDVVEPMHGIGDENELVAAKRMRGRQYPFRYFAVPEERAEAVAEFLASEAQTARADAVRASSSRPHPFTMQSNIGPETPIETWLTTFNQNSTYYCFKFNRIITIGDLINAFERDAEVFEKIGIPSEQLKNFNDIFLNFYRVFYCQRLKEEKRNGSAQLYRL